MKRYHPFLISLIAALGLSSCQYKELCYDHSHVVSLKVLYDWSGVPTLAAPEGMSLYFYKDFARSAFPEQYDLPGMYGGSIRIEWGSYQALSVNYDTESILYRGMESIGTVEAYTRNSSIEEGTKIATRATMPAAKGTEDQKVTLEPDMLYAGTSDGFSLEMGEQGAEKTVKMSQRVVHFTIYLNNVPNLQYSGQFGGTLSGLSGGVNLMSGKLTDEHVSIAFPVTRVDDTTLRADFNSFGHCPHEEDGEFEQHIFTLYAVLADGSKWYYSEDVTDQMHDSAQNPHDHEVHIHLDNPPVPKPIVNGSGFKPDVGEWVSVDINVGM